MVISGRTRLFYVIGDPITQIKTPEIINPLFTSMGVDILCVPCHVTAERLPEVWNGLQSTGNLAGLGVTLPHKQRVAELCDRLDETAALTGVVNCVRGDAGATTLGALFDGLGFVQGLVAENHNPKAHRVLIVGAGGAATAIAFALADAGIASLTIANRTAGKAELLSSLVNAHIGRSIAVSGAADPRNHTMIVNCTSLGMQLTDPLPVDLSGLAPDMLVADVVAKPEWTPLLSAAKERNCAVHHGYHMIKHQAAMIARFICEKDVDEPLNSG